jgi:hypothetical protein
MANSKHPDEDQRWLRHWAEQQMQAPPELLAKFQETPSPRRYCSNDGLIAGEFGAVNPLVVLRIEPIFVVSTRGDYRG